MNSLEPHDCDRLIAAALSVQLRAYAPYSHFPVGAAILHSSGRIYSGANVENASFGLTLCAERVAASAAVTDPGQPQAPRLWRAIAIASMGGVTPCGACRQFLMEFAPEMEVLLVDSLTNQVQCLPQLRQLLPAAFDFNSHSPRA